MTSPLPFIVALAIVLAVVVAQVLANIFLTLDPSAAF